MGWIGPNWTEPDGKFEPVLGLSIGLIWSSIRSGLDQLFEASDHGLKKTHALKPFLGFLGFIFQVFDTPLALICDLLILMDVFINFFISLIVVTIKKKLIGLLIPQNSFSNTLF